MKYILLILFVMLPLSVSAKNIEYITDLNIKLLIEEKKINDFKTSIKDYLDNVMNCRSKKIHYLNPIYNEKGYYYIKGKNNYNDCVVEINVNSLILHECALSNKELKEIYDEKYISIKENKGIENLSKKEEKYYNSKNCRISILKEIKRSKDVDKVLQENPNLNMILNLIKK